MFNIRPGKKIWFPGPLKKEKLKELRERSGVINCKMQYLKDQVDIKSSNECFT
jgi:hypothetical protein